MLPPSQRGSGISIPWPVVAQGQGCRAAHQAVGPVVAHGIGLEFPLIRRLKTWNLRGSGASKASEPVTV
jgi:hypothetical protein